MDEFVSENGFDPKVDTGSSLASASPSNAVGCRKNIVVAEEFLYDFAKMGTFP